MDLKFKVAARIARPVTEVFEAVVNPVELSRYFTTGGAKGRLETGATVMWDFHDFPGAFPVEVVEVVRNERIVLRWEANEGAPSDGDAGMTTSAGYQTTVTMTFVALEDGRTLVSISEEGWPLHARRTKRVLRQLPRLDADALRDEGVHRVRHQSARGDVQISEGVRLFDAQATAHGAGHVDQVPVGTAVM
jgi:uncharacterized protein YndB with AHSA1/START domain